MAGKPLPPVDDRVKIPDSVKRAAAAADAFYQTTPADPPAPPVGDPPATTPPADPPAPPVGDPPAPTPPADPPAPPADEGNTPAEQWEHRYRSMKGRFDAQVQITAQMQEQMTQLGDELVRTQQMLQRGSVPTPTPPQAPTPFITDADRQNYGNDLIELTQRAALEAVQPKLTALEQENQTLKNRVVQQSQMGVVQTLDQRVPTWREVNKNPAFKRWLSLRDIYSGVVRKQMLDAAYQAADAPRVVAFFQGFINDEAVAAGNNVSAPTPEPQPAPRQAVVPLERLAAPGRARPAGGNDTPNVPADKPIFTRNQISAFYADVRRGAYTGREAEKTAREREIFAAQSEGRVR